MAKRIGLAEQAVGWPRRSYADVEHIVITGLSHERKDYVAGLRLARVPNYGYEREFFRMDGGECFIPMVEFYENAALEIRIDGVRDWFAVRGGQLVQIPESQVEVQVDLWRFSHGMELHPEPANATYLPDIQSLYGHGPHKFAVRMPPRFKVR
jgi:hypothetical protein